tara:strand:- start:373 stop:582 length:210 start_codon:yes stop_codon:yes gene_type:complete
LVIQWPLKVLDISSMLLDTAFEPVFGEYAFINPERKLSIRRRREFVLYCGRYKPLLGRTFSCVETVIVA